MRTCKSMVIRACAGAGKTRLLVDLTQHLRSVGGLGKMVVQAQITISRPLFQNGAKSGFEMCFSSQHFWWWGKKTSRIQYKEE